MKQLDAEKTSQKNTLFIKDAVKTAGFSRVVVAVSGGVDSATSLTLGVKALGLENIYTLMLPYRDCHEVAQKDAQGMMDSLKIPRPHQFTEAITKPIDALVTQ